MILDPTELVDVYALRLAVTVDERGCFIRAHDAEVLRTAGLAWRGDSVGVSRNTQAKTLRGMHLQSGLHGENKVVRCSHGSAFDVVVDLRPSSETYGRWQAFRLDADEPIALYVPVGCAHGFLTLSADTEISYVIDAPYEPTAATGVRYDDPTLGIRWPYPPAAVSARDLALPSFEEYQRHAS